MPRVGVGIVHRMSIPGRPARARIACRGRVRRHLRPEGRFTGDLRRPHVDVHQCRPDPATKGVPGSGDGLPNSWCVTYLRRCTQDVTTALRLQEGPTEFVGPVMPRSSAGVRRGSSETPDSDPCAQSSSVVPSSTRALGSTGLAVGSTARGGVPVGAIRLICAAMRRSMSSTVEIRSDGVVIGTASYPDPKAFSRQANTPAPSRYVFTRAGLPTVQLTPYL